MNIIGQNSEIPNPKYLQGKNIVYPLTSMKMGAAAVLPLFTPVLEKTFIASLTGNQLQDLIEIARRLGIAIVHDDTLSTIDDLFSFVRARLARVDLVSWNHHSMKKSIGNELQGNSYYHIARAFKNVLAAQLTSARFGLLMNYEEVFRPAGRAMYHASNAIGSMNYSVSHQEIVYSQREKIPLAVKIQAQIEFYVQDGPGPRFRMLYSIWAYVTQLSSAYNIESFCNDSSMDEGSQTTT